LEEDGNGWKKIKNFLKNGIMNLVWYLNWAYLGFLMELFIHPEQLDEVFLIFNLFYPVGTENYLGRAPKNPQFNTTM
jgi:hypothetical protein